MNTTLFIKRLDPTVSLPQYARVGDAGLDLCARDTVTLAPGERVQVPTGLAVHIPEGCVGLIWDRSGLSHRHGLKTLGGVVDSGYRGEIVVGLVNLSSEPYTIERHHRIAQMIVQRYEQPEIVETDTLDESERGTSGFGSSGA